MFEKKTWQKRPILQDRVEPWNYKRYESYHMTRMIWGCWYIHRGKANEIKAWRQGFMRDCPGGVLTPQVKDLRTTSKTKDQSKWAYTRLSILVSSILWHLQTVLSKWKPGTICIVRKL